MKKLRILVVEDEALVARDICQQLVELGFEPVAEAGRGEEAIRLAGSLRPDLVLMDISLAGGTDGVAAAQAIRERFDIPVVFLTAFVEDETLRQAGMAESYGYIVKPFDPAALRTVIPIAYYKHQSDLRLRDSEARYRAVVHFAHDAIVTADPTGAIVNWNRGAERIFGYLEEEVRGRDLTLLMPTRFQEGHRAGWARAHAGGTAKFIAKTIELVGRRKDGGEFPLVLSLSGWASSGGVFVTAVLRDITERLQAEDRLSWLSRAVEQSPVTIVITDPSGNIVYVNPKFTELTGYTPAEALGRNPRVLKSGKMPPEVYAALWQTLAAGQVWRGELHNKKKNGELFWEQAAISALRDEDGKVVHYVAVKEDITERKELQGNLVRAHDEALAASRLKSEFLATVSHEIRTPMNGIVGLAEMLMETPLDEDQREMGQVIRSSADNLLVIINDILDFSKMEAGKLRIAATPFEMRALVQDTVALLALRLKGRPVTLRCEFDAIPSGRLLGDAGRIRQVLTNLAGNAIKFTESGEIVVTLTEKLGRTGRVAVRVVVRDTGIGIPAEARPKLFQAFTQVDSSTTRKYGGTGLGLAISRQLVELMGGKIGCESQLGRGSTFWFELELAPGLEPVPVPVAAPNGSNAKSATRRRILVADDNPMNQIVAQVMLARMGYDVDLASDGEEVLGQLARHSYAVILMDCQMPVCDGYETARRIRQGSVAGVDPNIPIIALTALAQAEDRQKCLDAGMKEYLSKPVRPAELAEALSHCGLGSGWPGPGVAADGPPPVRPEKNLGEVLDLSLLQTMRELPGRSGPSLLPELLAVFLREEPVRLAELGRLAGQQNARDFVRLAHIFAGSCANVGGQQLRQATLVLERAAAAGAWADVSLRLADLHEALARFHEALAQHELIPP